MCEMEKSECPERVESALWDFRDRPLDRDILYTAVRICQRLRSPNFCFLGEISEGQLSRCTGHPTRKSSPAGLGRDATDPSSSSSPESGQ
jgi:hypothetical protein